MDVLLITNIEAQKGLYRDAVILKRLIREFGHGAQMVDFRDEKMPGADLAIHLEVVEERFFKHILQHWWIPNPEWALPSRLELAKRFNIVLCKTPDAVRVLRPYTDRLILTGFMSEDRRDLAIDRDNETFFHAHRGSNEKGTTAIRKAWENITWPIVLASDMEEVAYQHEQNRCRFHLCPSRYEGWGHTIHEGLSVGAIVVSTDMPPMNEIEGIPYHIRVHRDGWLRLAHFGNIHHTGVHGAVQWCLELSPQEITKYSNAARKAYEDETASFRKAFKKLLRRASR